MHVVTFNDGLYPSRLPSFVRNLARSEILFAQDENKVARVVRNFENEIGKVFFP